jgi:hypothetical protein
MGKGEDMKVSTKEIFDAITIYYKNDFIKKSRGYARFKGVQIGNSDWYLMRKDSSNLILYKTDKDYDISNFQRDFPYYARYKDKVNCCFNFKLDSVNTVKKREKFSSTIDILGVA